MDINKRLKHRFVSFPKCPNKSNDTLCGDPLTKWGVCEFATIWWVAEYSRIAERVKADRNVAEFATSTCYGTSQDD